MIANEPMPTIYRIRRSKAKRVGEYRVDGKNPATGKWEKMFTTDFAEWGEEWIKSVGGTVQP